MAGSHQRAKRYAIALPVRYRLAGSDACPAGWTENLSVSGLLFTTTSGIEVGGSVEVWVEMSGNGNASNPAVLYCQGTVVRQIERGDAYPLTALRIAQFRILPFTPVFRDSQLSRGHVEQI